MTLTPPASPEPVPRRRGWRGRAARLVSVLALLTAFGCTESPSPANPAGRDDQWAAAAEAYLDARYAAKKNGFSNMAPFWTPNAHVDMRELNGFEGTSRPWILQNCRDSLQIPPRFKDDWDQTDADIAGSAPVGPIYLSRERAVEVGYVPATRWYCPVPVAVFLDLDEQKRITHEERFHRIDALRRCLPTEELPTGWWDEARIPQTPDIRITGWVSATPHDIAIWNGDPRLDPIVEWARTRFAGRGLPPPRPSSVTFLPPVEGDRWETFGFLTGSDAPDLGLPFTGPQACPDGPCRWSTAVRAATLHEQTLTNTTPDPRACAEPGGGMGGAP